MLNIVSINKTESYSIVNKLKGLLLPCLVISRELIDVLKKTDDIFPTKVISQVMALKNNSIKDSILLLKNQGKSNLYDDINNSTSVSSLLLLYISAILGEPFAYIEESNGDIVRSLLPRKKESILGGFHGANELDLHTEIAWCEMRPDFLVLLCIQARKWAPVSTRYISADLLLKEIPLELLNIMKGPNFQIGMPESMRYYVSEELYWSKAVCIVEERSGELELRINMDFIRPLNVGAERCLSFLRENIHRYAEEVVLREGDILIINNRKALHGRKKFKPRFDGCDRMLKQVYIKQDLERYQNCRSSKEYTYNALKVLSI